MEKKRDSQSLGSANECTAAGGGSSTGSCPHNRQGLAGCNGSTQVTVETVFIPVSCPEGNFTLLPEGVDVPPVDPAVTQQHHRSVSEILKV
ncbi:hypothetical protein F7725_025123 [Dissostichus mawsoni]|uniref:Uncharacterized protein n=1 Tax=Dissostichus mawsoni TaxID=36200 RepID=A0A7J5XB75_DISMA|nr:hypothetical protein F7725_025123 [Dissostichus mawsoni]